MATRPQMKLSVVILTLDASRAAASSSGWRRERWRGTVDKAHALGLKVYEGNRHYDVDNPEDFTHLEEELAAEPWSGPIHGGVPKRL